MHEQGTADLKFILFCVLLDLQTFACNWAAGEAFWQPGTCVHKRNKLKNYENKEYNNRTMFEAHEGTVIVEE